MKINTKNLFKLLISISIPLSIGFIGSFFTSTSVNGWYQTLEKPFFNPPSFLFAPVWSILYILIGISLFLIWKRHDAGINTKNAIYIFIIQIALNSIWSVLFFGLRMPIYALIEISLLWITILFNIILFYKISKTASYLLIPYILWVSFAIILNASIVYLN